MKDKILVICLILVCTSIIGLSSIGSTHHLKAQFQKWATKFDKKYKNEAEKYYRYSIFVNNYMMVQQHNLQAEKGLSTYKMALNFYSDILPLEYKSVIKPTNVQSQNLTITLSCSGTVLDTPNPPAKINWTDKGVITKSQNQYCPSSWAYAAVAAVEGYYKIKKGKLEDMSVAQVIQCSGAYGNQGCSGGFMEQAFWYIIDNGIALNKTYQTNNIRDECKYNSTDKFASIGRCAKVPSGNYQKLISAVVQQPVAVAVDSEKLLHYGSGIFDGECGQNVDRGMVIVGYGQQEGVKYWELVFSKEQASESGYVKIKRTQENGPGLCGLQLAASVPQFIS